MSAVPAVVTTRLSDAVKVIALKVSLPLVYVVPAAFEKLAALTPPTFTHAEPL